MPTALITASFDPAANSWSIREVPSPQQHGESIVAIDAVFAGGRVVARIDSGYPNSNSASEGHRLAAWRPGSSHWSEVDTPRSASAPIALDDGAAVPPGTFCTPFMRCAAGAAVDGRWYPAATTGSGISAPPSPGAEVLNAASTGGALVVAAFNLSLNCVAARCGPELFAWDPSTMKWTRLANPNGFVDTYSRLIWTGSALVSMGTPNGFKMGVLEPVAAAPRATGSATADQLSHFHWSKIAAAPKSGGVTADAAVWDGQEVLTWWEPAPRSTTSRFAAYDPADDRWRTLPAPPPVDSTWRFDSAVWTGKELLLFGSAHRGSRQWVQAVAYDVQTAHWHTGAPANLCLEAQRPVLWIGGRALVLPGWIDAGSHFCDYGKVMAYDPAADHWTDGARLPVDATDGARTIAATAGGNAVALTQISGGNSLLPAPVLRMFVLDAGSQTWVERARPPASPNSAPLDAAIATGRYLVLPPSGACADPICTPAQRAWTNGQLVDASTAGIRTLQPDRPHLYNEGAAYEAVVDTGSAVFFRVYGDGGDLASFNPRTFAWDAATGGIVALPAIKQRLGPAVWTGHELLFLDGGDGAYRLGP